MCGICGIIGDEQTGTEVLEKMMETIYHRGPDGGGIYRNKGAALGFRRLSIIDLENGSQPMYNEDKSLVLVFNGEIYNYQELVKELTAKGHHFQNHSDSECLLHAYEEYGKEMLKHLRGMFAFAIWDEKNETLFAARDFFGIKPFYYYYDEQTGALVFCSEIKSILQYPAYQRQVNENALDYYLSFQYSVLNETFFKGIYKLMPGHCLTWKKGKISVDRYAKQQLKPSKKVSTEEKRKKLEEALENSVNAHMISDVEVGVLLSGGVDSNYILAKSQVGQSFSVGFSEGNGNYSELDAIRETEQYRKDKNHQKVISATEFWEAIPDVMYHMDEPLADPSAVALYFVDEMASEHLKVVLSGEGADELFGGYRIYREPKSLAVFNVLGNGAKKVLGGAVKKIPFNFKGKNYILRGCQSLEKRFIGNAKIFSAEEKQVLLKNGTGSEPGNVTKKVYDHNADIDAVARMQEIDINFWLQGDILLKADKMSMAHSLESRVPYLDREVFKVAKTLTVDEKIDGQQTKMLFRGIAGKEVPGNASQRKKLGFPIPIRVWLRQEQYCNKVRELFHSTASKQYFHVEELDKLLDDHFTGKKDNSRKIWTVYVFLVWYQVYFGKHERVSHSY